MTPVEIGLISVIAIVLLVYVGVYIPIALGVVSFLAIARSLNDLFAILFDRGRIDGAEILVESFA